VRLRVRFCETDLMGIVHHGSYVIYLEVARIEWLRRRGVAYATWARGGLHLAVIELGVRYRLPARFDDEVDVDTSLVERRAASVRFDYRLLRVGDGALLAEAFTRLACIDGEGAPRRIGGEIEECLARPDGYGGLVPVMGEPA
jgi:acyl-CoA thioester hydrolase